MLSAIKTQLDQGRPCILHVKGTGSAFAGGHYVVATAYSGSCTALKDLTIVDPWNGKSYSGSSLASRFTWYGDRQLITFSR